MSPEVKIFERKYNATKNIDTYLQCDKIYDIEIILFWNIYVHFLKTA